MEGPERGGGACVGCVVVGRGVHLVVVVAVFFFFFVVARLQQVDDGFVVSFSAELEECAALALFGVSAQVAFFLQDGEDVEVLLRSAFVVVVY